MCTMAGHVRVRQRYDQSFEKREEFFKTAGKWSLVKAQQYQLKKLQELACHAYHNVPFYKRLFDQANIKPQDIRSLDDWNKLPSITKDDVRVAGSDLIAANYDPGKLILSQSGGSTGMPLVCYHDNKTLQDVHAAAWAYCRPGVTRKDRFATFQGLELIPPSQKAGPYWRFNKAMNQRLYSIFHLSESTIKEYIDDIDNFKPVYFAGYANSLYLLAKLAEENGIIPKWSPKAVLSTSEQLLSSYKETIETVFRTKVWDAYSQDETCGSITEYECGYYHYDRAYGYMEFEDIEIDGNRKVAEIICTGLLNYVWPLLRYRVGDIVEYEIAEQCPGCGRAGPIIHSIRGRTGDVVVLPSGRRFPHISLIVKNLHGVRQLQIVQEAVDRIIIRYVPSENYRGKEDDELIVDSFQKAFNEPIKWVLQRVDRIEQTRGGKFLSIVNEIKK